MPPPWLCHWDSVPNLNIDLTTNIRSWATATTFLSRCVAPIHRVCLHGLPSHLTGDVNSWPHLIAGKRPRSLALHFPVIGDPPPALPAAFSFDADVLAELKLRSCSLTVTVVGFFGFHTPATLSLDRVIFLTENGWRQMEAMLAVGKELFADTLVAELVFPWVALGKLFTECYRGFAVCHTHTTNVLRQ